MADALGMIDTEPSTEVVAVSAFTARRPGASSTSRFRNARAELATRLFRAPSSTLP